MSRRTNERFRPNRRVAGGLTVMVGALATIVVASAVASNIQGSPKPDTLRGTAKADKLYGKGGNDRLFGLGGPDYLNGGPGNDVLAGGPGADVLVCGPGNDKAAADAADKVGADCETVTGLPKPAVSVAAGTQPEGNSGSTPMTFTVTLAKATPLPVSVSYATANGTATSGSDFVPMSGSFTFGPGETSKSIAVSIVGDTVVEPDETFTLTLSNVVNAVLGQATASATIQNDDRPRAKPGHYHGQVSTGGVIDFDVTSDAASVVNVVMLVYFSCQPGGSFTELIRASFTVPVLPDGSFDASGSGQGLTAKVNGRFVAEGVASGTLQIHLSYDEQGTHYECDTGNGAWGAAWRG
jgi:hypothetical protein